MSEHCWHVRGPVCFYLCVYVCCSVVPGTTVLVKSPRRNMNEQLWQLSLWVDDEGKQTIDFEHSKWEFPITAKVRTANC